MAVKKAKKAAKKVAKPAVKSAKKVAKKAAPKAVKAKAVKAVAKVAAINIKKMAAVQKPLSKSQIIGEVSEQVGISRKQASAVLEVMYNVVHAHLRGCGVCKLLDMFKVTVVNKPARKARKGVNPFTGEEVMFKAKPASKAIKVRPLKKLKEMVK